MRTFAWVTALACAACGSEHHDQTFREGMAVACRDPRAEVANADVRAVVAKATEAGPVAGRQIIADAMARAGLDRCALLPAPPEQPPFQGPVSPPA